MRLSNLEHRVLLSAVGYTKRHFDYDIPNQAIFPVSCDRLSQLFDSLSLGVESVWGGERRSVYLSFDAQELRLLQGILGDLEIENELHHSAVQKLFSGADGGWLAPEVISYLFQYLLNEAPETAAYERLVSVSQSDGIWDSFESLVTIAEWSSYQCVHEDDRMDVKWTTYERQILTMALKVAAHGHIHASSMYFRELIRNCAFDFGCSLYISLTNKILP